MNSQLKAASSTNATIRYQWLIAKYDVFGYNGYATEQNNIYNAKSSQYTDIAGYSEAILTSHGRIVDMLPEAALAPQALSLCFLNGLDSSYDSWKNTFMQDYSMRPRDEHNRVRYPDINTMVDLLMNLDTYASSKNNPSTKSLSTKYEKSRSPSPKGSSQKPKSDKCTHCGNSMHTVAKCYYKDIANAPTDWLQKKGFKTQADADKALVAFKEKYNRGPRKYNRGAQSGIQANTSTPEARVLITTARSDATTTTADSDTELRAKALHTRHTKDHAWYADTAATYHMTHNKDLFIGDLAPGSIVAYTILNEPIRSQGNGTILIHAKTGVPLNINNVHYCPDASSNLLSIGILDQKGFGARIRAGTLSLLGPESDDDVIFTATRTTDNVYMLNLASDKTPVSSPYPRAHLVKPVSKDVIHKRLGHVGFDSIPRLLRAVDGLVLDPKQTDHAYCEPCTLGKQTKKYNTKPPSTRSTIPGERWHIDIAGGGDTLRSLSGNRYCFWLTCDATRYRHFCTMKSRDQLPAKLDELLTLIDNTMGYKCRYIRSDNELVSCQAIFSRRGIQWEPSAPYAPDQDGVAERTIRTILSKGRAMMFDSGLNRLLWEEILQTSTYLTNRVMTRACDVTPYEGYHGHRPDLSNLRVFGCRAYALDYENKHKLAPRSWLGVLVGYKASNQWRIYNGRKVFVRKDVEFDESNLPHKTSSDPDQQVTFDQPITFTRIFAEVPIVHTSIVPPALPVGALAEAPNPAPVQPEIPTPPTPLAPTEPVGEQITPPAEAVGAGTSAHHPVSVGAEVPRPEPPSNASGSSTATRRSNRARQPIDYRAMNAGTRPKQAKKGPTLPPQAAAESATAAANSDNTQDTIALAPPHAQALATMLATKPNQAISDDPTTYEQATSAPDAEQWLKAMDEEMESNNTRGTWTPCKLPDNRKALGGKWVYKKKNEPDGSIRYKARWVVQGFRQVQGIDYDETYAATIRTEVSHLMTAIATAKQWYIEHVDIVTAFLYSNVKNELYIRLPKGYTSDNPTGLLNKGLYGLKQGAYLWFDDISTYMQTLGLKQSSYDPAMFFDRQKQLYVTIWVDDITLYGPNQDAMGEYKSDLRKRYEIKAMGPQTLYLGMEVKRDQSGSIDVTQRHYTEKLLERFGMEQCKPAATPMQAKLLCKAPEDYKAQPSLIQSYQELEGSLMHLMVKTRPDICFAVSRLGQFASNPTQEHYTALKRVVRYVAGTKDRGIRFNPIDPSAPAPSISAWTDASWAEDLDDSKSTSGFIVLFNNAPIMWQSHKQTCVARSSTEAEYLGQSNAAQTISWLRAFLIELDIEGINTLDPTILNADNQGAIKLANSAKFQKRSKHIAVHYHYTRDLVSKGQIELVFKPTDEMIADGLTKALGPQKWARFIDLLEGKNQAE
jgi:hypothetical protein